MDGPLAREITAKLRRRFLGSFYCGCCRPCRSWSKTTERRRYLPVADGIPSAGIPWARPKRVTKKRSASDYLDLYDVTFRRNPRRGYRHTGGYDRANPARYLRGRSSVVIDLLIDQSRVLSGNSREGKFPDAYGNLPPAQIAQAKDCNLCRAIIEQ